MKAWGDWLGRLGDALVDRGSPAAQTRTIGSDGSVKTPLRQAFTNGVMSSEQRATVLSFDSLMGSTGVDSDPA